MTGDAVKSWVLAGLLFTLPFSPQKILADYAAQIGRVEVVLEPEEAPRVHLWERLASVRKAEALHTVQPGEALAALAAAYGSSVEAIKKASGLKTWRIQPGQELVIPFQVKDPKEPRLPPGVHRYVVQKGDTLERIAKRFGLTLLELVSANPTLKSLDRIPLGATLLIPEGLKGRIVVLGPGETLADLARAYGLDLGELARANGVKSPLELKAGDLVLIPGVLAREVYARLERKREEERRLAAERRRRWLAELARRRARLKQVSYRPGKASLKGFQWPLTRFRITSYYGYRRVWVAGSNFHYGIDLAAPAGTPVYAARGGRVIFAGWGYYYGRYVRIDHGGGVETRYAHLSRLAVRTGQYVRRGQVIGYVGASGRGAYGVHLHFEIRLRGRAVNPLTYLPR